MPIEIDAIWKLVNPVYAILVALIVIILCAFVANHILGKKSGNDRNVYLRQIALAAELLVSIGIIGLVTFTARQKIDSDIRQAEAVATQKRRHVNAEVFEFAKIYCMGPENSAVTRDSMAINYTCKLWPEILNSPESEADIWVPAWTNLVALADLPRLSPDLVTSLRAIASAISELDKAKGDLKLNQHKKGLVESEVSWWLVAVCSFFAALGIALKWVRAAAELREAQAKYRNEREDQMPEEA